MLNQSSFCNCLGRKVTINHGLNRGGWPTALVNRLMEAVALSCPPPLIDLKNKKTLASPIEPVGITSARPGRGRSPPRRIRARPASSSPDPGSAGLLPTGSVCLASSSPDLGEEGRELPLRWSMPPLRTRGGRWKGSHNKGGGPYGREGAAACASAPCAWARLVHHQAAASRMRTPKLGAHGHRRQARADAPTVT
jgi:hypothetical protein